MNVDAAEYAVRCGAGRSVLNAFPMRVMPLQMRAGFQEPCKQLYDALQYCAPEGIMLVLSGVVQGTGC